jgi:hypothetical protein
MERLGELTPHLNPLPSEGRGEARAREVAVFANNSTIASPLLLEKRRGEGEELVVT